LSVEVELGPLKLSWEYTAGKGTVNWHPGVRKQRQDAILALVPPKVTEWFEQLLTDQQKAKDETREFKEIAIWASVDALEEPDEVAERIARSIVGSTLRIMVGNDRQNWPTLPAETGYPEFTFEQLLNRQFERSKHKAELLANAEAQMNLDPKFVSYRLRVATIQGRCVKAVIPEKLVNSQGPMYAGIWPQVRAEMDDVRKAPDQDAVARLTSRAQALNASGRGEDQFIALVLALVLNQAKQNADEDIKALMVTEPDIAFLFDPKALALRMVREHGAVRPPVVLPTDVAPIAPYAAPRPGITQRVFGGKKAWAANQNAEAEALVAKVVESARTLPTATEQYYALEEQVEAWRKASADPVLATARFLLLAFLNGQKAQWARKRIQELYTSPRTEEELKSIKWNMNDHLVLSPEQVVDHGTLDPSKLGGVEKTLLPFTKANAIRSKVAEAWTKLCEVVDPRVLNAVPPCKVVFDPKNDRAYHYKDFMVVGPNVDVATIMHEFGHHLEGHLPVQTWYQLYRIIERRSGDARKVGISHPADWERGYVAEVGGIGKHAQHHARYATRYYGGSATEVLSTGIEALADPATAYQLYLRDPEQFAVICNVMRTPGGAGVGA
jgi:hypothetical protein